MCLPRMFYTDLSSFFSSPINLFIMCLNVKCVGDVNFQKTIPAIVFCVEFAIIVV